MFRNLLRISNLRGPFIHQVVLQTWRKGPIPCEITTRYTLQRPIIGLYAITGKA